MEIFINLIGNPWVFGITTSLIGALLYPIFMKGLELIQASFGPYSGQYIAYTYHDQPDGDIIIDIEDVRCHHNGHRVSGKILGVATGKMVHSNEISDLTEKQDCYSYNGFIDERVFVITYRSQVQLFHSCGAIALNGDSSGRIFIGSWAGLSGDSIIDSRCVWIKMKKKLCSRRKKDIFLEYAKILLLSINENRLEIKQYYGKLRIDRNGQLIRLYLPSLNIDSIIGKRIGEDPKNKR